MPTPSCRSISRDRVFYAIGDSQGMLSMELQIDYPDERTAQAVLAAVAPDNDGYVDSQIVGSTLVFRISSEKAGTMRNTADDLLACIKAAEESVSLK